MGTYPGCKLHTFVRKLLIWYVGAYIPGTCPGYYGNPGTQISFISVVVYDIFRDFMDDAEMFTELLGLHTQREVNRRKDSITVEKAWWLYAKFD